MRILKNISVVIISAVMLIAICSCSPEPNEKQMPPEVITIDETYSYSTKSGYYLYPSLVDNWVLRDALKTETDNGTFFCFTADKDVADDFVNSERTLLGFLGECGMPTEGITAHGTDYGFSFSESDKGEVYISISHMNTWQQVLATLGALWGDYTDYGYIYAMSNAIAAHLGWEADNIMDIADELLPAYFIENPDALNLQYPCFTEEFADSDTVNYSKALSVKIMNKLDWHAMLAQPIDTQLNEYFDLVAAYANESGIEFERTCIGYAYYSESVPLRIMTTYAEMLIDDEFAISYAAQYGDEVSGRNDESIYFFGNWGAIYRTSEILDSEMSEAVEYFGLQEQAGVVEIKWLTGESAILLYDKPLANFYNSVNQKITLTIMNAFLHEYYHHLEHLLNPYLGAVWQSQAFCELGHINSYFTRQLIKDMVLTTPELNEIFEEYTGHTYADEYADYYETYDILTYIYDDFDPTDYYYGRNPMISFNRYLTDIYGLDSVYDMMIQPDTIEDATGKTWETLILEWETHIRNKYAGKEIPDWLDKFRIDKTE
ncbi:MAG: hypothetical protein J6L96_06850 [Clostridia bacterium]|nr:hypothetical protein [Clostridia bacterium]